MNRRDFFRTVAAGLAIPVASVVVGKVEPKGTLTLIKSRDSLKGSFEIMPHPGGYQWRIIDGTSTDKWPSAPLTAQELDAAVHDALVDVFKGVSG